MPRTPKKRGRPGKYDTPEDKARRDVVAKRARRRLRKQPTHDNIRFQIYVSPQIGASPLKPSQDHQSYETNLLGGPPEVDSSWNRTESPTSSIDAVLAGGEQSPQSSSGNDLVSPCPQRLCNLSGPRTVMGSFSTSQGGPAEILLPSSSDGVPSDRTSHAAGDDDMSVESDRELCHISSVSSPRQAADPPHEKGDDRKSSWIACEDDLSRPQNNGNIRERAEEIMSDLESQPENTWEPDSSSESDVSDLRSEVEIDDEDERISGSLESDIQSAKCFLERNWGYTCGCDEEEEDEIEHTYNGEPQAYGLLDMVDYWQGLGVPDSIGRTSPHAEVGGSDDAQLDWSSILSGGDNRPKLDIQISQSSSPDVQRTWDVDSVISWATCLSINRGLYVSYHSPPTRNLASNIHVFHQGKPLHIIPHLRMGSGRQSPQFGVYVFFPGISHVCRTTTYLTKNERRMWIDQLLLPAIRYYCPPDVVQHHPRSFDDVESKAYSRQREACSGMVRSMMDMHHRTCESGSPQAWVLGGLSGIRPGSRQRHFILSKFNHNDAFSDMYIKR
jgi:hypothetical protein